MGMILSGWKEIASYLHCGVRTVQRWETSGLPVHRPAPRKRGHVIAHAEELDRWIRRKGSPKPEYSKVLASITHAKRLHRETHIRLLELSERVGRLRGEVAELYARRQHKTNPPAIVESPTLDENCGVRPYKHAELGPQLGACAT
jgi:hypothetical protein